MRSKAAVRAYAAMLALDQNVVTRDELTRAGVPSNAIDIFYPVGAGFGSLLPHLMEHLERVPSSHLARAGLFGLKDKLDRVSSDRYGLAARYEAVWYQDYELFDQLSDYFRLRLEDESKIFLNSGQMGTYAIRLSAACWWAYQAMGDRSNLSRFNRRAVDNLMLAVAHVLQLPGIA